MLGGTVTSAAAQIGIRPQAISGWPDELTPALRDRVQAALYRQHLGGAASSSQPAAPTQAVAPISTAQAGQGV